MHLYLAWHDAARRGEVSEPFSILIDARQTKTKTNQNEKMPIGGKMGNEMMVRKNTVLVLLA